MTESTLRRGARHPNASSLRSRRPRPPNGRSVDPGSPTSTGVSCGRVWRRGRRGTGPRRERALPFYPLESAWSGRERDRFTMLLSLGEWVSRGVWMHPHKEVSAALCALRSVMWISLELDRHQRSAASHLLTEGIDAGAGRRPDGRSPRVSLMAETAQLPAPSRKGSRRGGGSSSRLAKPSA
jgi:hypothetical protein